MSFIYFLLSGIPSPRVILPIYILYYCIDPFMLSSSQPLIRTFWSFNLSHPFEKWLWFWFSHSYLKERASHLERVFGSWIWIIEKLFLWKFLDLLCIWCVLRWWLESLLLPSIQEIVMRSIFFGDHCLVYKRTTSAWPFLQGDLNSLGLSSFFIREFSWPMISSCYFSATYSFFLMSQQIWYGWHLLCRREGALTSSGKHWT